MKGSVQFHITDETGRSHTIMRYFKNVRGREGIMNNLESKFPGCTVEVIISINANIQAVDIRFEAARSKYNYRKALELLFHEDTIKNVIKNRRYKNEDKKRVRKS